MRPAVNVASVFCLVVHLVSSLLRCLQVRPDKSYVAYSEPTLQWIAWVFNIKSRVGFPFVPVTTTGMHRH